MINLPYDSVQITNMRTGFKWVKLYPDTVLFSSTVGINDQNINFPVFGFEPNFPNPVDGLTHISLNTTESGTVFISLFDMMGNLSAQTKVNCEPGIYSFKVAPPQKGIYILEARSAKQKSSVKLIQTGTGDQYQSIELENNVPNQLNAKPSQTKDDSNFFVIGDSLSFTCWKNGNTKSGSEKIDHNGYIFFNIFTPTTGDLDLIGYWGTLPGSFPMEPTITTITNIPYQNYVHFVNDSLLTTTRNLTLNNTESGWFYAGVGETWGLYYIRSTYGFIIDMELGDPFGAYEVFNIELYTNNFFKMIYVGSVSKTPLPPEGSYDYFIRFP